jgi:D-sedoheptulose 7-phosphate isomerase
VSPEATDFLYPFIEADERDATSLLDDLARSAAGKWSQSGTLRTATLTACEHQLRTVAAAMAARFAAGGQLFSFGNGGSATDADGVAQLFTKPPYGTPLPARSLASDQAVLTALGNDVGFDKVFSRQLIAHARPNDMAVGYSTSGNSENLLVAFTEAHKRGVLTVGLAGYDGGQMARCEALEHCIVARSDSVHRIQETQAALTHVLWGYVQEALQSHDGKESL